MKILNRYLAKTTLKSIGVVVLLLLGLLVFILTVGELDDIGVNDYGMWQAFAYVVAMLPAKIYEFFPMACLLGTLMGLNQLANQSELVVMRAAGMSQAQITGAVLQVGFIIVILMTLMGETLAPALVDIAKQYKNRTSSGGQVVQTVEGLWLKRGKSFIHIASVAPNHELHNITRYRFDDKQQLKQVSFARRAQYASGRWTLVDLNSLNLGQARVTSESRARATWLIHLDPKWLQTAMLNPAQMSLPMLWSSLQSGSRTSLGSERYALAFYQRLMQPLTAIVMLWLAIPFIFGPLRSASSGLRFLAGAATGFAFFTLNRFFGPLTLVYHLPPWLGAMLPVMLFALLAALLARRH